MIKNLFNIFKLNLVLIHSGYINLIEYFYIIKYIFLC